MQEICGVGGKFDPPLGQIAKIYLQYLVTASDNKYILAFSKRFEVMDNNLS